MPALSNVVNARHLTVNNSTQTTVTNPLNGANVVQCYIRPSSTQQIYTITLPNTETIEIASGDAFLVRVESGIAKDADLFTVQTASSSAVLQVTAFRESQTES